ncbi:MlaD family protein [Sporolituus thermophilus]|uniref:Phospholipid/cholesterol/gamma-HCH transport system substrate-binding protein n=1 Tax=Sporolituus thermophilus DSM 23256 TaxID=1123285 RepID=A0A1G7HFV4_9FIRM|nr:MlaD family protein [Sporolituus thermophilus]SDE99216.1 phospholipid/cholesterol/gamma-HCH transport system substrate-binding protein [Sporolituus thermophilus DSM 23256]
MNLSTEAKVGAVTIVGLLLLAYMIVHLGGFSFSDKGYPVTATFNQVSGLKEGNLVRYAGVEVGRVQAVSVAPEGVKVRLLISPGVKIPQGARFTIGTDGLLGEKFINILPPAANSGFLPPGAQVRGEDPQGLDQLIATADRVLLDIQALVKSLNDVLGDEKVKGAMKQTLLNARQITDHLNELSASLARMAQSSEGDIQDTVRNLRAMSGSLRDVAARVDKLVANVDNNGQTATDLRETLANLKATSARVEKMAASLEGVVTDPETSRNLKETLRNAREASEKANRILSKVDGVKAEAGIEMLYDTDNHKYRSSADVRIQTSPRDFAVIGVSDIGDSSKTNFQVGRGEGLAGRAGVIDGKAGIGVDAKLGQQLRLSVDAYDPNDVRVKLRTQYQIAPDTFVVGQVDGINKSADTSTSVGVRTTF